MLHRPRINNPSSSFFATTTASAPLPPRFFQLDSNTLQTGLEERIRDLIQSSLSPLVSVQWMEEFRALVEIVVSSACFGLGLLASSSIITSASSALSQQRSQANGYTVNYGDQIYNLRYVAQNPASTSVAKSIFSSITLFGGANSNNNLLVRLILRFILLSVLPVFSRLLQRRFLQREEEVPTLHYVRNFEKILRVLDLLNHVAFLYSGAHRHVVDRLLGIRLASGDRDLQLSAHTYLIDRQHYWQTMFAAMSLFIPLLNLGGWMRYFAGIMKRIVNSASRLTSSTNNNANNTIDAAQPTTTSSDDQQSQSNRRISSHRRTLSNAEKFECLICHTEPMAMPRRVKECGHVCVCYYCSQTAKLDACPECHGYCSGFVE